MPSSKSASKNPYMYWSGDRIAAWTLLFGIEAPLSCAFM